MPHRDDGDGLAEVKTNSRHGVTSHHGVHPAANSKRTGSLDASQRGRLDRAIEVLQRFDNDRPIGRGLFKVIARPRHPLRPWNPL